MHFICSITNVAGRAHFGCSNVNPITNVNMIKLLCVPKYKCLFVCVDALRPSPSHDRMIRAVTRDFQQCGILTSVDSNKALQLPFGLRNPN